VIKHFLREVYGGSKYNEGARSAVVRQIQELVNSTLQAWSFDQNFLCTCPNGSATGWECCTEQANCATEPCPCPDGFAVPASVACCDSVCTGLAGNGIMTPFSYIKGEQLAEALLASMGTYLQNDIWISTDPWLKQDPMGADSYRTSWNRSQFDVADAGLFNAAEHSGPRSGHIALASCSRSYGQCPWIERRASPRAWGARSIRSMANH
jgi:hypothetical protein